MTDLALWVAIVATTAFVFHRLARPMTRFSITRYLEQERERYRPPPIISDGKTELERQRELRREEWALIGELLRDDGHDMDVIREPWGTELWCATCGEGFSEQQLALYEHRPCELLTKAPIGLCTSLHGPIDGGF